MIRFWLVDKDGNVVFNTRDKQEAYEYQNRRRPDTVLKMVQEG
jgi:ribosomal protein L24E